MYDFYKNSISLSKFFFQMKIFVSLFKKFNSVKKFSFARNEQA